MALKAKLNHRRMNIKNTIIMLPTTSAVWFFFTIILGGFTYPNYQHTSQYISELGASGAPNANLVNYLGFIPTSILLSLFVMYALAICEKRIRQVIGLIGIGIFATTLAVAAVFPCSFECNLSESSVAQDIHNLSALVGYLSAVVGIFFLSSDVRRTNTDSTLRGSNSTTVRTISLRLGVVVRFSSQEHTLH